MINLALNAHEHMLVTMLRYNGTGRNIDIFRPNPDSKIETNRAKIQFMVDINKGHAN